MIHTILTALGPIVVLPITMVLVAPKGQQGQGSMLKTVLKPILQPLVILPILGAILAIAGVKLPEIAQNSIDELGKTAGGVALFFLGFCICIYISRLGFFEHIGADNPNLVENA